jgi:hypothetical protein
MAELHSDIEIDAPEEVVWQVLADLDRYAEWNPFMRRASGRLQEGEQIEVYLKPPKGMGMTIKPKLLKVESRRELRWLGHLVFPGLFDGEHIFIIEPRAEGGVSFVQREQFRGILAPLMLRWIGENTLAGFKAMNEALKAEAEQAAAVLRR